MSDARVLGALVVVGEALVRGHLPGCVCAQCVAARAAIGGATEDLSGNGPAAVAVARTRTHATEGCPGSSRSARSST